MIKFIQLVLARGERRTELQEKHAQFSGLAERFKLLEDPRDDHALQFRRDNQIAAQGCSAQNDEDLAAATQS